MSTTSTASVPPSAVLTRSSSKKIDIKRPRPLHKSSSASSDPNSSSFGKLSSFEVSSVENTMSLLDNVALKLGNGVYDSTLTNAIFNLSASLKSWGPFIEVKYKDRFDKCQVALRSACRDEKLAMVARLHLLEIFELRAMSWKPTESMTNYYKQKITQVERESQSLTPSITSTSNGKSSSSSSISSNGSSTNGRNISSSPVLKAPLSTPARNDAGGPTAASGSPRKKSSSTNVVKVGTGKEIQVSVYVGDQEIKLSGFDSEILEVAESVLQKHFKKRIFVEKNNGLHSSPPESKNRINNNALQRSKSVLCDSHVNVIRAPLFPESPRAAFREEPELLMCRETRERRAQFARHRSKTTLGATAPHHNFSNYGDYHKNYIHYDRKQLLEIARSEACSQLPPQWNEVLSGFPEIALTTARRSPLPMDWEATFLFSKKSQYSEHCDREGKNATKFVGRDSRS